MATDMDVTSPQEVTKEEFAVPEELSFYARDYQAHIEGMYDVKLSFDLVAEDHTKTKYQWISLTGKKKNCRDAKVHLVTKSSDRVKLFISLSPIRCEIFSF